MIVVVDWGTLFFREATRVPVVFKSLQVPEAGKSKEASTETKAEGLRCISLFFIE
jgi:hypothetical protein